MAKWRDVAKETPKQTSDRILKQMRDNVQAGQQNRDGKK
jgi:hypothetical protein